MRVSISCFHAPPPYPPKAVRLLENRRLKDECEEKKWRAVLIKLYLNVSLCYLRMRRPKPAITNSRKVLELEPKNVKAIFRLGQVRSVEGSSRVALTFLSLKDWNNIRQNGWLQ